MEFVQQNIFWIALALLSGGMLVFPLFRGAGAGGVSPVQAVMLINRQDAAVIDVRDSSEFEAGHLPNARHIPLADLEKRAGELTKLKKKPVILVCQTGARSSKAVDTLRKLGFEQVLNLAGGVMAWSQASQPLVKGAK